MADDSNEIKISITLDDGSVREGFARIQQSGEVAGNSLSEAFSGLRNEILGVVAAYLGFEAGKKFIEDSIDAASAYDKALNDMNKSLSAAGGYTQEASKQFLDLADAMEQSTTLDAKKVLSLEALANNYAHTNDEALKLTKAAIEFGAATGKGPEVALQQLGATLDGTAGRIGKLLPQLQRMTKYELESGAALDVVLNRFSGSAESDVNTFSGSLTRLGNAFESVKIAIGEIITQSPAVRGVIQFLTTEFTKLADYLKSLSGNKSFMRGLIDDAIEFGIAFNSVVIAPIEVFYQIAKTVFTAVETAIVQTISVLSRLAGSLLSNFGLFSKSVHDLSDKLLNFADTAQIAANDFGNDTVKNLKEIGNTKFADAIEAEFIKVRDAADNARPFDQFKGLAEATRQELIDLALETNDVKSSFQAMGRGIYSACADMVIDSDKLMQQMGQTAIKSIGGGMATAMAAVGKAAAEGKDIFKAFAGAMISALGGALVQMGAGYITLGLAREIASYGLDPTGYELIGIGSGMAALGGVLQSIGGGVSSGGSASASVSSGGGSSGGISAPTIGPNPANQIAAPTASVTVNIQGSVFDTQETGLRIVELVNSAFTSQGANVLIGTAK